MTGSEDDAGADLDDLLNPLPDPTAPAPVPNAAAAAGATTGRFGPSGATVRTGILSIRPNFC